MSARERIYFAVCAAAIGWSLGYALPIYARLPRNFYDPILHKWMWTSGAGPIAMGYWGQMVWGLAAALFFAGIAGTLTRFLRPASERAHFLWGAWALTALTVIGAYFTWNNLP